jgi:hypothetical protein
MIRPELTQPSTEAPAADHRHGDGSDHRGRHHLLMAVCCGPMLVLVGVLIATGVVAPRFILVAAVCMAMMTVMMSAMHRSGTDHA